MSTKLDDENYQSEDESALIPFDRPPRLKRFEVTVMVNRYTDVGRDIDTPNDKQNSPVLEFNPSALSDRTKPNDAFSDLIRALADSLENRRARQTSEWETLRRQNLRRAS